MYTLPQGATHKYRYKQAREARYAEHLNNKLGQQLQNKITLVMGDGKDGNMER